MNNTDYIKFIVSSYSLIYTQHEESFKVTDSSWFVFQPLKEWGQLLPLSFHQSNFQVKKPLKKN